MTIVNIEDINALARRLRAVPKQITRATRNAIDGVAGERQRFARDTVNASTGIKKKDINANFVRFRTQQNQLNSRLIASSKPFLLRQYRIKKRRVSKTRQQISAAVFIGRPAQVIDRVFINPRGKKKRLLRRPAGVDRYPVKTPAGLSMAQYLKHIELNQPRLKQTGVDLSALFLVKLAEQQAKARR